MRRIALCLILLCASPLAFGRDARPAGDVGDCRDSVITVPSPVVQAQSRAPAMAAHKPRPATTVHSAGGGSDEGGGVPRVPRWHSFLPGMFR